MKIRLFSLLILTLISIFALLAPNVAQGGALSGVTPSVARRGINSSFGISGIIPGHMENFSQDGVLWATIKDVRWGDIEPYPPAGGGHTYKWQALDRRVGSLQKAGFNLKIEVSSSSPWGFEKTGATGDIKDWAAFVEALVERYDADGKSDMDGLNQGVRYWQLESLIERGGARSDSAGQYADILKVFRRHVLRVERGASVILASFDAGPLFCAVRSAKDFTKATAKLESAKYKKKLAFIRGLLAEQDSFDYVSLKPPNCIEGIGWTIKWLNAEMLRAGYKKPMWVEQMASGPFLGGVAGPDKADRARYARDMKTLRILDNPKDARFRRVNSRYRAEQCRVTVKKSVIALANGALKVFVANPIDWVGYYKLNQRHFGLLDRKGRARPALHAYGLLIKKLDGFTYKKVISHGAGGVFVYRFIRDAQLFYIVWTEGEPRDVRLEFEDAPLVRVTNFVPLAGGGFAQRLMHVEDGGVSFEVGPDPLIVEPVRAGSTDLSF